MSILTINAGSSSLKFAVYPLVNGVVQPSIFSGNIEGLEPGGSSANSFTQALTQLREQIAARTDLPPLKAIAHRVVHGGSKYRRSVVVTEAILSDLEHFNPLAPLHQPHNLAGIRAFTEAFAELPQVACFDTAFHTSIPEVAAAFALPQSLSEQGIRRYGFHGLSYQYIMGSLQQHSHRAKGRVLMAHLGNGASLCGAVNTKSCATTMGFSAVDGLMMGTRCGTLDAGVMLHLLEQGWNHDRLQALVYKQSGLLGVSGISADMRRLRASASSNPAAQNAIDLFTHRVVRESGAMIASIGGLDVLAFSGGIGEHDAQLRQDVCQALAWLGVEIDAERNQNAVGNRPTHLHAPQSRIEVWLIPTDEGSVAAREAAELVA